MNRSIFVTQLNKVDEILRILGMNDERNGNPNYQGMGIARIRNLSYRKVWVTCFVEHWYDFSLSDQSLLQFRAEFGPQQNFHYAYYEAPHHGVSYRDYLVQDCGFSPDELDEIGDTFRPEYEDTIATARLKEMATPIRYDFEPDLYTEGVHPASHIHIGHRSNVRIATKKLLRPISFFLFVLRQVYPERWMDLWQHDKDFTIRKNVRDHLDDIAPAYYGLQDQWEMTLF